MKLASLLTLAALLAPVAAPAATILFDEDFAEEALTIPAVGGEAPNAVGLDSFDVLTGSVDLFTDGGFGLPCPSGGCLDLDGSVGDLTVLRSKQTFTFKQGVRYALTAYVRGNARGGASDVLPGGRTSVDARPRSGLLWNDRRQTSCRGRRGHPARPRYADRGLRAAPADSGSDPGSAARARAPADGQPWVPRHGGTAAPSRIPSGMTAGLWTLRKARLHRDGVGAQVPRPSGWRRSSGMAAREVLFSPEYPT
jgi:hypothetical protein